MQIRKSPSVVLLNSPRGVTVQVPGRSAYVDGAIASNESFLGLLEFCATWRDVNTSIERLCESSGGSSAQSKRTIDRLVAEGILECDARENGADDVDQRWAQRGWSDAYAYHETVCNLPRFDYKTKHGYREDLDMMEGFVAKEQPPDNYKDYPDRPFVAFASNPVVTQRPLGDVLRNAPFVADEAQLGFDAFSWLTYLAYGQTAIRRMQVTGHHVAKTSPSGGSRHPTEVYPIVLDVDGVEPGVYHYSVRRNGLEQLASGDLRQFVRDHVVCHPTRPGFSPAVIYLYTSIFARSMFRYREPFSYRVMSHDIGHLMQTTRYLARAIRRPSYTAYSFHDARVAELLSLDGITESPMAFSILG